MKLCIASLVWLVVQAVIWGVEGAADCAPSSGSLTIKTSQDVSDVSKCTAFTGNIVVAADGPQDIQLSGLTSISGNIDIENVGKLQSLASTSLEAVSSFTLNNLPQLSNLSFPALKNFSSLKWSNLPSLDGCTVAAGAIEGEIQQITIFNTSLKSLDWLKWPVGAQLNVTSNANLETFTISYNSINANSALTVSSNPSLKSIDVSSLTGIYGGLDISGNNIGILSFGKLETIGGFVQLSGDYTNISMPSLNQINGALSIESTKDISSFCNNLAEKKLTGHYDCTPNAQKNPSNPSTTASPGSPATASATATTMPGGTETDSSISNRSVKIGIAIAIVIFTIAILVVAFFYFRKRTRAKVREIEHGPKSPTSSKFPETDSIELTPSVASSPTFPKELETPTVRLEMATDKTFQELPASVPQELEARHGWSELNTPVSPAVSVTSVNSVTPLVRHELPA